MKFLVLMAEEDSWDRWEAAGDAEQARMMGQLEAFAVAVFAQLAPADRQLLTDFVHAL